jgi:cell division septation protein DedD
MENRLKERLTGAAILVALIVMLVPEMFNGQRGNVAAVAGSSGEGPPVRSYTIDLSNSPTRAGPLQSTPVGAGGGAGAASGAGSGNDEAPASAPNPLPSAASNAQAVPGTAGSGRPAAAASLPPVAPAAVPSPSLPEATAPVAATPKAAPPVASGSSHQSPAVTPTHSASAAGWVVQLGLFAKRDNAERLAHSAQAQGFAVSVSNADAKGLYRVYAGGMSERSAAEAYAQRLKDHGLTAAVLASP